MTTRKLASQAFVFAPRPEPKVLSPELVRVDGMTWEKRVIGDGVAYAGRCVCGSRLLTGIERVKPSALRCRGCGRWASLP